MASTCISAYLIDPKQGSITAIAIDKKNSYEDIRADVGSRLLDLVRLDPNTLIYLDDEGLIDGLEACTCVDGAACYAGKLVVIGTDELNDLTFPQQPIEEIAKRFVAMRPVMDPVFQTVSGPNAIGCQLTGFKLRIERSELTID
jgi:hypothetical protein